MDIATRFIELSTEGYNHIYNITSEVQGIVRAEDFIEGQVTVFAIGSTTGISTIEFEPGLIHHDVKAMMEQIAPYGKSYEHNKTWGDDNGASHLRSTLTGTSLNVPFKDRRLILGTWQQIVFIDFDTSPRNRKIVVQIVGRKQ